MLRPILRRVVPVTLGLAICGLAAACDSEPVTAPQLDPPDAPAYNGSDNAAFTDRGTFTVFPPPLPVNAPCVDPDNPLRMIGSWSGWDRVVQTAGGRLHVTEHIDWSDVILRAEDGRIWAPGPGAHESFSLIFEETPDGFVERNIMHNLRARFNSLDGDSDLQVWHTIHIVRGPDHEIRVSRIVLPFEAKCIGK